MKRPLRSAPPLARLLCLAGLLQAGLLAGCSTTGGATERAMSGAWVDPAKGTVLYFEGGRCVMASDATQLLFDVDYGDGVALRTVVYNGQPVPGVMHIEEDELVVIDPMNASEDRLQRAEGRPDAVRLDPYRLGTRVLTDPERNSLEAELAYSASRDQGVRRRMEERILAARASGRIASQEDQMLFMTSPEMTVIRDEMIAIDRENTLRMIQLVQDVGWISTETFGAAAHDAAFLIVQHGGNLRLMLTVLPLIEAEALEDPAVGQLYALLFDRTELGLGRDQRYGTQLLPGSDGTLVLARVQSFSKLDARRAEMGLMPIDQYLALLEPQFGEIEIDP